MSPVSLPKIRFAEAPPAASRAARLRDAADEAAILRPLAREAGEGQPRAARQGEGAPRDSLRSPARPRPEPVEGAPAPSSGASRHLLPQAGEGPDDDDTGWTELDPASRAANKAARADVVVAVQTPGRNKRGYAKSAVCRILFREDAAAWIEQHARFRVEIGGRAANRLRITPAEDGRWDTFLRQGVSIMTLGAVGAWPSEGRARTVAAWRIEGPSMVLTLPETWAIPVDESDERA